MLATLALATIALSSPLHWDAAFVPTRTRNGPAYRVELYAKNVSQRPIVFAQAIYDGAPAGYGGIALTREGEKVEPWGESSMPQVQVMVHHNIDKNRFRTIKPGERVIVYWFRVEGRYDFKGALTRSKEDHSRAERVKLEKGTYRAMLSYTFDQPVRGAHGLGAGKKPLQFGPDAQALWESAFRGKGSAAVNFTVR